jgi:fibrillarin-like pre-rRNA processing protein
VYTDGRDLFTRNLAPGISVYGEPLVTEEGVEYRRWDPRRSKLAALLRKGCRLFPFERRTSVLYLGAAQGTTASHISDIVVEGTVYAVERSPRAFRRLMEVAAERTNLLPLLADANDPSAYEGLVRHVDVLYQDVAQRNQAAIFLRNLPFLRKTGIGFLMIKARSVDVAARPRDVYAKTSAEVRAGGVDVLDVVDLAPFETDHAALIVERS